MALATNSLNTSVLKNNKMKVMSTDALAYAYTYRR